MKKRIALIARIMAALVFALAFTGCDGGSLSQSPLPAASRDASASPSASASAIACRVTLSINPTVEFHLGADGMVLDVVGLDEDGIALIEGTGFAGLSLENATITVVNRLIQQKYISPSVVDDDILIRVSGETVRADTLDVMSAIIRSAASAYELPVDAQKTGENELKLILASDGQDSSPEPSPNEGPTPSPSNKPEPSSSIFQEPSQTPSVEETPSLAPSDNLPEPPTDLKLEYEFYQKAVGNIFVYPDDRGRLPDFFDFAGMPVPEATFHCIRELIEKGYISDKKPDVKIVILLPGYADARLSEIKELIGLMVQEAGLSLDISRTGPGQLALVRTDTPAPPRTAKYTMTDIYDITLEKKKEELTDIQLQILSLAFTPEQIEFLFEVRHFFVIPDLVGLPEEKALELCKYAGFTPHIVRVANPENPEKCVIGTVIAQDFKPGDIGEAGTRYDIWIYSPDAVSL